MSSFKLAGAERTSVRRIVVSGFPGSGKSTFSVSASKHAGDELPVRPARDATDVLVINGDSEGYLGPVDAGLTPLVVDLSNVVKWSEYLVKLNESLQKVAAFEDITTVVIDAALPAKLIVEGIAPTQISDWQKVAAQGLIFFRAFNVLAGRTVILNTQVKPSASAVENDAAKQAAEAKAIGGERATFTMDLPKGIAGPWTENASLVLAREVRRVKDSKTGAVTRKFFTHTSASPRLEVKSRFSSRLAPTVDGNITLRKILDDCSK